MKKPKPQPPRGAPHGTVWVGGPIPWFVIRIEIAADDLKPDEITALLGVAPTEQHEKGKPVLNPTGTRTRIPKFGRWSLSLKDNDTDEWDVNEAAKLVTAKFEVDQAVWKTISAHATVRFCLALFLETANQGLSLDPDLLRWLADREIQLDIDIYEASDSEEMVGESKSDHRTSH